MNVTRKTWLPAHEHALHASLVQCQYNVTKRLNFAQWPTDFGEAKRSTALLIG
ncbi:hypothetical protein QBD00_004274 [Ochrobactrum sp. AN78]|jgi:hypothetical protein|nr:hypothetical protein [Ochrobactrum sp. AN78]